MSRTMTTKAIGALTFTDWCLNNSNVFWRKNKKGVAVALSDVSLPVFNEMAKLMGLCHWRDKSCGELVDQVLISKNSVWLKSHPTELSSYPLPDAQVVKDLKGFNDAVQQAVTSTLPPQSQVPPPADCFKKHFDLLKNFDQNSATLKNYEFLLRNSPLLLSPTGKLLMFRKVLSMSEYSPSRFFKDVGYFQSIGSNWMNDLSYPELIAVRNFKPHLYMYTDGTVKFYRNCLGHIREHEVGRAIWSDDRILQALEDDVPRAMPEWYHSLMGLKPHQCISHCGFSLADFLHRHPSVFT